MGSFATGEMDRISLRFTSPRNSLLAMGVDSPYDALYPCYYIRYRARMTNTRNESDAKAETILHIRQVQRRVKNLRYTRTKPRKRKPAATLRSYIPTSLFFYYE